MTLPALKILLLLSLLTPFTLAFPAPAPAKPASSLNPPYEIVLTVPVPTLPLPSPTSTYAQSDIAQKVTTRLSIITPAPELRHRQWSVDLLPTETETEYYWDGEGPYSWPAGEDPPWVNLSPNGGGTIVNSGRLTVTLGRREGEEERQLSPITYISRQGGGDNSILPVETEGDPAGGYWEHKTFTFAGQTFTIGGTGVLTLTLGKAGGGVGVRTAMVEERQELSYEGGKTRGSGSGDPGTVTDGPTVTYTDAGGEVRTLTVGGSSDSVAFTQVAT